MSTTRECPHCLALTHMTYKRESAHLVSSAPDPFVVTAAFTCDACERFLAATAETPTPSTRAHWNDPGTLWNVLRPEIDSAEWEPKRVHGKIIEDIPGSIADPADEAFRCHSIGAYRASVLMARAVIEASAKEKGVENGALVAKIDRLVELGYIRQMLADAAHQVRLAGNEMAHGDFATAEITEVDSEELLGLMEDFLDELFAIETRVARRRAKRST